MTDGDPTDGAGEGNEPLDDEVASEPGTDVESGGVSARGLFRASLFRLRERPALLVPFALAGLVAALVDAVRFADPVPVQLQSWPYRGTIHVTLLVFPGGSSVAGLSPGTVLGLRPVFLAELVVLWGVALAATVVATGLTVIEASGGSWREVTRAQLVRLFEYAVGVSIVAGALVLVAAVQFVVAVFALLFVLGLAARLFVAPPLVMLDGATPVAAALESNRRTRRDDLSLGGVVLVAGILSYVLVSVPYIGTVLSTAVVGAVYAVATVVAYERC